MGLAELLKNEGSSRVAIRVSGGGPDISYSRLCSNVETLADRFRAHGISGSDRVAIALPNGPEAVVTFLAAAEAGAAAPMNPAYKTEEFRFYLEDTAAGALVVPRYGGLEARAAAGTDRLLVEVWRSENGDVESLFTRPPGSQASGASSASSGVALILHTSGTTSRPKRVPLSDLNLRTSAINVAETYGLVPDDVSLCVMPLFHVHGLVASTLATLFTGGTVVIVEKFNPLSFWATVREHGVTWYSAVPTIHQVLLARAKGARPPGSEQLRFIRSCSAPLSPAIMAGIEERFGVPVLEAYGMTEAAHQIASNPLPPSARKPGSVGMATGVDVAILNREGALLQSREPGEVAIRGRNVTPGYESNPEANADSFTNGWFRTGDEGYLDEDGYLFLVGRIKELINRGGEKIAPREVDEALESHPCVEQAVCFGVPDRVYGEGVAAAVVVRGRVTEAELIKHCKARLADYKAPGSIYFVDQIPRTATGKIQRRNVALEMTRASDSTDSK